MAYIGIDLGTTNSVASKYNELNGEVEILVTDNVENDLALEERQLVRSVVA